MSCAVIVTVLIMVRSTINNVYLYDILKLTPDFIAYLSIAYNTACLIGALVVNVIHHDKQAIYGCIGTAFLMSCIIAVYPSFTVFIVSSVVFGLLNSINRVMYDSVIMKHIPNHEVGTFYGFLNSINQGSQFIMLFAINLFLWFVKHNEAYQHLISGIILFYPAIFLFIPIYVAWSRFKKYA